MENKKLYIIGGGTFSYVRSHLALAAPAFGKTARQLEVLCKEKFTNMDIELILTKMADSGSYLITNEDVRLFVNKIKEDLSTKVIFFNPAMVDYRGMVEYVPPAKHAKRLKTSEGVKEMLLMPEEKVLAEIRKDRKDIFVVGFKSTCGASTKEQYIAGLDLLKRSSVNLVLVNDVEYHTNMIVTPEESRYEGKGVLTIEKEDGSVHEVAISTSSREAVLKELVEMTYLRSHLTFTHSTVVDGVPVPWNGAEVYPALREVVNYCISKNAYKPFNGATVGHFACKISPTEFLTSIRKSNFNDIAENGLVRIKTDGPDSVIAYGAKPSVGGQSQRIVFEDHPDYDCIVHFHCPIKIGSDVPVISQREYECGSHECGRNTSGGLKKFGNLSAVMLDNHGPNIVFHHSIDPKEVIDFIESNFKLAEKTGGPVS